MCAIHTRKGRLFEVGEAASAGLTSLAEDGVTGAFVREVRSSRGVRKVATGDFTSARSRSTVEITSKRRGKLSCVLGMLVSTNDGFAAFSSVRLRKQIGQSRRFRSRAYDAGSEVNTE